MKAKRITSGLLILVLCVGLTACGEKAESTPKPTPTITPTLPPSMDMSSAFPQTWDIYNLLIPTDMEFTGGSEEDPNDIETFSLKRDDDHYINFHASEKKQDILAEYHKRKEANTNNQIEMANTYGEFEWEGFQYDNELGEPSFEMCATHKRGYMLISAKGYSIDGPVAVGVISSIVIDEIDNDTTPEYDSSQDETTTEEDAA